MRTREDAAARANFLLLRDGQGNLKRAWHFGRMELRDLMDFIYEGEPEKKEERIK